MNSTNKSPLTRLCSKRQSIKPRAESKSNLRPRKTLKSTTPIRKPGGSSKRPVKNKVLGGTLKYSAQELFLVRSKDRILKDHSEKLLADHCLMKTQNYFRPSDSDSDKCNKNVAVDQKFNFVITSNDLYGDYSVRDEEQENTIIKHSSEDVLCKTPVYDVFKPEHKKRIVSSTGGKNSK